MVIFKRVEWGFAVAESNYRQPIYGKGIMKIRETIQERFEAKFTESDGCWEWEAFKNNRGYGKFRGDGGQQLAHRVAYQLYIGEIPDGMCVCHHCDNPSCVNPAHLFLGTDADNVHDREDKGRGVIPDLPGEKHSSAKLTNEQVIEIRARRNKGERVIDLAKEFGVAEGTISGIAHRHYWTRI